MLEVDKGQRLVERASCGRAPAKGQPWSLRKGHCLVLASPELMGGPAHLCAGEDDDGEDTKKQLLLVLGKLQSRKSEPTVATRANCCSQSQRCC